MQQVIVAHFPPEVCVTRPQGGHVLWLEMPPELDAMSLYRERALNANIAIAPGVMFSASGNYYNNCCRLNTAVGWTDEVERAIEPLGDLAKTQLAVLLLQGRPQAG